MLRRKARSAVRQYALFRWESAVVISGTILLTVLWRRPFGLSGWPAWGWPALGGLVWAVLVCSTLTDPHVEARFLAQLLEEEYNPFRIHDAALRAGVETALEHLRRCEEHARQERRGAWRDWLWATYDRLTGWVGDLYRVTARLDLYRSDARLAQERRQTPDEIEELAARRRLESDPAVQRKLDEALEQKGRRWQELRAQESRMAQVERELQHSLAALAAVCDRLQMLDARSVGSDLSARLRAEIEEQIARLDAPAR